MGAEYWEHIKGYEPDAQAALLRLQTEMFQSHGYDLAKILQQQINGMADAIRSCEEDDPYNLLEHYRDALRHLRRLAECGVPDEWTARLKLLRQIEAIASDQAPGVLAVEGISSERSEGKAHLLTSDQIEEFFGTSTPSLDAVREGMERLTDTIDRATAVMFPVFEGGRPTHWYFAGYTWD